MSGKKNPYLSIGLIVLMIIAGILILYYTPLGAYLSDIKKVRADIEGAGIWSYVIFIGIFVFTALFNIPELPFLFMAYLVFNNIIEAALVNYIAGVLSAIATFYTGRLIGAGSLSEIKNIRIKRLIAAAENNPIGSLLIIRTIMLLNPIVGYTLSLTKMTPRNYIIGNLICILITILYVSLGMYFMRESILHFFEIDL